ncbi:response regulator [Salibacteraceae bacterium]|nr:response regulator [Salibacteraceae bacterium]
MSKRHISIIDDDYICRMVVRKQVASSAYETRTSEFENGQAAVDYYIENSAAPAELPDVLFLDIFMPILDGWQFLERFAELSSVIIKSPQIFILSSTLDVNDIERAEENPLVSGFIPKPVNLRQVERIIHKSQYYGLTA